MSVASEEMLFQAAAKLLPANRIVFLDMNCASDPAMRRRLEALLLAHDAPTGFMSGGASEKSAIEVREGVTEAELVGQFIGRYKLLEKIGEGGCGVVYVAEQSETIRRRVALKVIKLGMDTRQVVARFEAERQALAMMDHPNIAKVLDAGATEEGRPYFVMELVRGIRITEYCDQNHLTTNERLQLFIKVCQAIQHAHQKGIIHRDIKPSNILVTLHDGVPVPKVIDFGIAKATEGRLTDATVYTQLHQFIGTPAYMSPEQAEMSGLDIDTRADIYSLGVLLYELLTGKTPFDGNKLIASGLDAMRKTIRETEPIRPSTRIARLKDEELTTTARGRSSDASKLIHLFKGDLDWIVMKCLEKDRSRRYETANGLAADLKRHFNNEPVVARPPSTAYRFQKAWRRNRLFFSAGATVAITLVCAAIISIGSLGREKGAHASAVQALKLAETNAASAEVAGREAVRQARLATVNLYAGDMKAAGQFIADGNLGAAKGLLHNHLPETSGTDLRGWEWRYFLERSEGDRPLILTGHTRTVTKILFSPDARYVATIGGSARHPFVAGGTGELILWEMRPDRSGWNQIQRRPVADVGFTTDGRLGVVTPDGRLELSSVTGGEDVTIDDDIIEVLFSPITNHALLLKEDQSVWWLELESSRSERILTEKIVGLEAISPDAQKIAVWGEDTTLFVLDIASRKVLFKGLTTLGAGAEAVFLPGKDRIIYTAWDTSPRILDLTEKERVFSPRYSQETFAFPDLERNISQFSVSAKGSFLAASSFRHQLILWTLPDLKEIRRLHGHQDEAWTVAISKDERILASGGQDKLVMLWSIDKALAQDVIPGAFRRSDPVFTPDGECLALWGPNDDVTIFDLVQQRVRRVIRDAGYPLRFEQQGKVLLCLRTNELRRWLAADGRLSGSKTLEIVPKIASLGYIEANLVAIGGNTLCFYEEASDSWHFLNVDTLQPLRPPLKLHSTDVAISPSGRALAMGLKDFQLFDLPGDSTRSITSGHSRNMEEYCFSRDGSLLATICSDTTIRIWDVARGVHMRTLRGHKMGNFGGRFSMDGKTLCTVNNDRTLKLWHVETGREIASIALTFTATQAGFSPDGRFLVAWGETALQVWSAPLFEESQPLVPQSHGKSSVGTL